MVEMNQEKRKRNRNGLIVLSLLVVLLVGYGVYELVLKPQMNGTTLIDNPTDLPITVTIDGSTYTVPENSFLPIKLEKGNHRISCDEYSLVDEDLIIDPVSYGVINPTQSKYVVYNIIYTQKKLSDQFEAYEVEGREVYSLLGKPEVTTALFIADLTSGRGNIDEKTPSTQHYNKVNSDYSYLRKIFRLDDFFEFYDKQHP